MHTVDKLKKLLERQLNINDKYVHFVAAGAWRKDGKFVTAVNGHPRHNAMPSAHAEMRLLKKVACPSEVVIIRMNRGGKLLNSLPCRLCVKVLQKRGVKTVVCIYAEKVVKLEIQ